jgi:hypothetical protein
VKVEGGLAVGSGPVLRHQDVDGPEEDLPVQSFEQRFRSLRERRLVKKILCECRVVKK